MHHYFYYPYSYLLVYKKEKKKNEKNNFSVLAYELWSYSITLSNIDIILTYNNIICMLSLKTWAELKQERWMKRNQRIQAITLRRKINSQKTKKKKIKFTSFSTISLIDFIPLYNFVCCVMYFVLSLWFSFF